MTRALTQTARVLAKARSFDGVCQADFAHPTCDGLPPITRVAARLYELDVAGYSFEVLGRRKKCKIFRLVSGPEGVESEAGSDCGGPLPTVTAGLALSTEARLFEVGKGRFGFADQEDAAA